MLWGTAEALTNRVLMLWSAAESLFGTMVNDPAPSFTTLVSIYLLTNRVLMLWGTAEALANRVLMLWSAAEPLFGTMVSICPWEALGGRARAAPGTRTRLARWRCRYRQLEHSETLLIPSALAACARAGGLVRARVLGCFPWLLAPARLRFFWATILVAFPFFKWNVCVCVCVCVFWHAFPTFQLVILCSF